jgi:hypothetical protein
MLLQHRRVLAEALAVVAVDWTVVRVDLVDQAEPVDEFCQDRVVQGE